LRAAGWFSTALRAGESPIGGEGNGHRAAGAPRAFCSRRAHPTTGSWHILCAFIARRIGGSLMQQYWKVMVLAPAIMVAAACHKNDNRAAADSALNRDLNLANQVAPYDSISPLEAGAAPGAAARSKALA